MKAIVIASALLAVLIATPLQAQPPNIVWIVVDDADEGVVQAGLAGGWMPNLQTHVISRGTTFSNSYLSNSLCCPSRVTMLTGQYSHNHGVKTNVPPLGGITLFNDTSTLPVWLQAGGYRTGMVGKYINGYGANSDPSTPKDDPTYRPPGWTSFQVISGANTGMYGYTLNDNGILQTYGSTPADYQTDVFAGMASAFIPGPSPFFLLIAPSAPHQSDAVLCTLNYGTIGTVQPAPRHVGLAAGLVLPQSPSYNEATVTDKPTWLRNNYPLLTSAQTSCLQTVYRDRVESMMAVDDLIGAMAAALNSSGQYANTAIGFTSDNGYTLGDHRLTHKEFPYEPVIRVPLYIAAPGYVAPQATSRLALNNDWAPTILALAAVTVPASVDGRSLLPLMVSPGTTVWRKQILIEHWTSPANPALTGYRALRTDTSATSAPNMLWVRYFTADQEFYDLTADPWQLTSRHLCGEPPCSTQKSYLDGLLTPFLTCAGSGCRSLEDQ